MEKNNIFIGKINKDKCYVNDGKYGYFLTCNKKNYKIPEWFPHEKMDLETAKNFIAYKDKMAEVYADKPVQPKKEETKEETEEVDGDESSEEEPTLSLSKNKKK